ncbi:MAG: ABC transporter permease [Chloroflexota bacterium]
MARSSERLLTPGVDEPVLDVGEALPADGARPVSNAPARRGLPTPVRRLLVVVAIVVIWQGYVKAMRVSPLLFSAPSDVLGALVAGIGNGELLSATAQTLQTLIVGMLIGCVIAVVLSGVAVSSRVGDDVLATLSSMLNPLPAIAVLPLAMLWFGLTTNALIFVIAQAVVWPLAINISMGFRTVPRTITMVASTLGLHGFRMVTDILLPAALPHIITGLKTSWAFGWRTIVAAELVFGVAGGSGGLGWFINLSRYFLRIPDVFAGLVVIAIIGMAIEGLFSLVELRTVDRWGMRAG